MTQGVFLSLSGRRPRRVRIDYARIDELALHDELNNVFSGVHLPILMLGNDLRLRRFTPRALVSL